MKQTLTKLKEESSVPMEETLNVPFVEKATLAEPQGTPPYSEGFHRNIYNLNMTLLQVKSAGNKTTVPNSCHSAVLLPLPEKKAAIKTALYRQCNAYLMCNGLVQAARKTMKACSACSESTLKNVGGRPHAFKGKLFGCDSVEMQGGSSH